MLPAALIHAFLVAASALAADTQPAATTRPASDVGFHCPKVREVDLNLAPKPKLRVDLGEPVVVAVASKAEKWGRYQFPGLARWEDGRICVSWHMAQDSATAYGSAPGAATSKDGGRTWSPHTGPWGLSGLLLPGGDRIAVTTPKSRPLGELKLPEPVVVAIDTYGKAKRPMYRLADLPPELRVVHIKRMAKGSKEWTNEQARLDDPQALRYSTGGVFPIVWWGDLRVAPDGSILAGIYPGYLDAATPSTSPEREARGFSSTSPERKARGSSPSLATWGRAGVGANAAAVNTKGNVFFYRSTDAGRSWQVQGRILYQPDLTADLKGGQRDGFTEPAFDILPGGVCLCVMRTTDGVGIGPMYASRSTDLGKTWSRPEVFARSGVLPKLLRLENGVVVLASGRPGVQLRFCTDGQGRAWTDPTELLPYKSDSDEVSCGYTALLPTGPDRFLIAYSDFRHLNATGQPRKAIKVREVTVRPE